MEPAQAREASLPEPIGIRKIPLVQFATTRIDFKDRAFEISSEGEKIKIARDAANYALLSLKNQQVSYKSQIMGGFALSEEKKGDAGYGKYLSVDWEHELTVPELLFIQRPQSIIRSYKQGQWIELGIEEVSHYHVSYQDGVSADFRRKGSAGFQFSFSTGFYGSFRTEPDGSYTLTFKGDRLKPGENDFRSQSKFIISRSKYTGMLLLILQEEAKVSLH